MTTEPTKSAKPKPKDFKQINGNCKLAALSDGYTPQSCPNCNTNHKLKTCPWCGWVRGKK